MTPFFYFWAMSYKTLQQCISDLDKKGELKIISEEVNPELDIASIHLDEFAKGGKAILFENIKGSKFRAVSNLFGTLERSRFMFRGNLQIVKDLIDIKTNPIYSLKNPAKALFTVLNGIFSISSMNSFACRSDITMCGLSSEDFL